MPKASEKLYILDSIDVPLSDLSKYRHLSVVNKLPENIVLPPPPPLRHVNNVTDENESIKLVSDDTNSNHVQHIKNDFEMNVDYDSSDLVETKNISIVQNVKKLIKKYQKVKQREQMRTKPKNAITLQHGLHVSNEHSTDLSTPLRSLSPAHDFDEIASAVDLTVNSKEIIDEFIDNLSMCTDDSGGSGYDLIASPLAEILQLTEPRVAPVYDRDDHESDEQKKQLENHDELNEMKLNEKLNDEKHEKHENHDEKDENEEKVESVEEKEEAKRNEEEVEKQKARPEEEEVEKQKAKPEEEEEVVEEVEKLKTKTEEEEKVEKQKTKHEEEEEVEKMEIIAETQIETLQNICIKTVNTKEFRNYFTENVINAPPNEETMLDESSTLENDVIQAEEKQDAVIDDINCIEMSTEDEKIAEISTENQISIKQAFCVPTLRKLAMAVVRQNQFNMAVNLKPFKPVFELETERKMIEFDSNIDLCGNKVRTLQELARDVAITIYSFNVKPLHDICKLAIEKFSQFYLVSRDEETDIVPEIVTADNNFNDLYKGKCLLQCELTQ